MSSTITTFEKQQLPKSETIINDTKERIESEILRKKLENKREHFTRTSSIERLKRFNTFICSQHYYILPALLCCLKSSKTILQSTLNSCIHYFKDLIYKSETYKFLAFHILRLNDIVPAMKMMIAVKYNSFHIVYKSTKEILFALCVYTTILAIFAQLLLCLYFLTSTLLPGGFIFLCTCIYLISQLNFNVLKHMSRKESAKICQRTTSRKDLYTNTINTTNVIKPKQMLCNRTISNVNLF